MELDFGQTIIAPVTPPGEGGVGILRLSGAGSEQALLRYFFPSRHRGVLASHHLYHGHLRKDGDLIDEVLAVVMRAPHSFTREEVVEIHCHGGPVIMQRALDLFLDSGTVRLAAPGEFTLRAFLNGRIDLAQAEAVIDVIRSRSEAACSVALRQMEGRLSKTVHRFRHELADLLAMVEAHIDFPEEDVDLPATERLARSGREIQTGIESLLATFEEGRVLREGLSVLIVGRPNVGKSSLLNALLGERRAIVTDRPGTTRDTIEESLNIGGIPLRLIDTAGIRQTADPVEIEGVHRARLKVASADLVLLVIDGSIALQEDDLSALESCKGARILLVINKSDLPPAPLSEALETLPLVRVSTHTGDGIDDLRRRIALTFRAASTGPDSESVMLSDRRHREALLRALEAVRRFSDDCHSGSLELLAVELRDALQALGEITGETTPDEILGRIFSRFCIGK